MKIKQAIYEIMTEGPRARSQSAGLAFLLLLLSWIYGFYVRIISSAYRLRFLRRYSVSIPIISVGNITMGGVGKTPIVQLIAQFFKSQNLKPAVILRGYGKTENQALSDEGMLLSNSLGIPVIEGRDKFLSAKKAVQQLECNTIVVDDGFQHWRLKRNLDIVLIDATNPFGNGFLIPRGILREPLSALKRAGMIILTKTDSGKGNIEKIKQKLSTLHVKCPIIETIHEAEAFINLLEENKLFPFDSFKNKKILSFCGIGNPDYFEYLLKTSGAKVIVNYSYGDHHDYSEKDIGEIIHLAKLNDAAAIVTTEKDAVKLKPFLNLFPKQCPLVSLKIKIKILQGQDEFFHKISSL